MKIKKWVSVLGVILLVALLGMTVDYSPDNQGKMILKLGSIADAAGDLDYTFDGTDDDVQFQAALNALPATGGELVVVSATTINFSATVTRAIANVTITGSGRGTYFAHDGATDLFTAGGNNWTFRDLRTDAGDIGMGATTGWSWENVTINATYYAYRTDDATTAANWNIPTGRSSTLFIAASNATTNEIAQADYVCDGTDDEVQINAAITALPATGGQVKLSSGSFVVGGQVTLKSYVWLQGSGRGATIVKIENNSAANTTAIGYQGAGSYALGITLSDLTVDGNKANQPADGQPRCAVWFDYIKYFTIKDLIVHDSYQACGITISRAGGSDPFNSGTIMNCIVYNCDRNGIDSSTNSSNARVQIAFNQIDKNGWNGIAVSGGHTIVIGNAVTNSSIGNPATYSSVAITGAGSTPNTQVKNNYFYGTTEASYVYNDTTTAQIRDNVGWKTENSGTGTLLNGQTTIVINHGLATTPTSILITFAENPTNAIGDWWIDTLTTTQFTFNGVDPGASNLDFYWRAVVGAGN